MSVFINRENSWNIQTTEIPIGLIHKCLLFFFFVVFFFVWFISWHSVESSFAVYKCYGANTSVLWGCCVIFHWLFCTWLDFKNWIVIITQIYNPSRICNLTKKLLTLLQFKSLWKWSSLNNVHSHNFTEFLRCTCKSNWRLYVTSKIEEKEFSLSKYCLLDSLDYFL